MCPAAGHQDAWCIPERTSKERPRCLNDGWEGRGVGLQIFSECVSFIKSDFQQLTLIHTAAFWMLPALDRPRSAVVFTERCDLRLTRTLALKEMLTHSWWKVVKCWMRATVGFLHLVPSPAPRVHSLVISDVSSASDRYNTTEERSVSASGNITRQTWRAALQTLRKLLTVFWFKVNLLKATPLNNWPGRTLSYWWVTLALSCFIIIHRHVLWAVLVNTVTWMVLKSVARTKWRNCRWSKRVWTF